MPARSLGNERSMVKRWLHIRLWWVNWRLDCIEQKFTDLQELRGRIVARLARMNQPRWR